MLNNVAIVGGFQGYINGPNDTPFIRNMSQYETTLSGKINNLSIQTDNSYSVVTAPSGIDNSAILDGVTITGGYGTGGYNPGAGINASGAPTIIGCRIVGNTAGEYYSGGGVYVGGSGAKLISSLIADNTAHTGGGVYLGYGTSLLNCTITANTATRTYNAGGGIYCHGGGQSISSCIIYGNHNAANSAADLYAGSPVDVDHTILLDTPQTAGGYIIRMPGTLSLSPQFIDAGAGNYRLSEGSPCVDMGHPNHLDKRYLRMDVAGSPREEWCRVDMRVYEPTSFTPNASIAGPCSEVVTASDDLRRIPGSFQAYRSICSWN